MEGWLVLQASTLTDMHVNLKDVIYIGGILVTLLTAWFKLKHDNDKQTEKIKNLNVIAEKYYRDCKEEFMNAKNGRISIRRDVDTRMEKLNEVIQSNKDIVNSEMKEMSTAINTVKSDTAEIKGMISTLLNKK